MLFVTHRISLAKQTDKIYILENSSIRDSGSLDELISNENYYVRG
ncbi:hypothetical protein [Rhodohalobacter sulfatireducens]|nr:hypothetical protein [Rhodohalobacter sulfatireducens]